MRQNDGRKLDHKTLETLRLQAVDQVQQGAHPEEVALALGLHRKTVYGWLAKYRDGGPDALLAKPVPGRPPRLKPPQVRRLWTLIVGSDPRQLEFESALWTREMVRELIRREFGVGLSVVSVGRLLAKMGLSQQRSAYLAYQRDSAKVRHWKEEEYPQIATQAAAEGATICFADEAGIRSDHHAGTAWAPVGAGFSVNMISAITPKGTLRFAVFEGTTTAESFIAFCKRLLHDAPGPVNLIVDGRPSHRAKAVTQYVASTGGRLKLFFLPGCSPELNPYECVKNDRIARDLVNSKKNLKAKAASVLRRLRKLPALVRGFFTDPRLRYITIAAAA